MPSPFQFFPTRNFPLLPELGREWSTNQQLILPDENIGEDAQSTIRYNGQSQYKNYHSYNVRHETLKEAWIRIDKTDRKKAIFVEEFAIFSPHDFSFAIIKSKHKIATELLRRISQKFKSFDFSLRSIDLMELKNDLAHHIKGGWFKDLEIEDVSTAAIFGNNVSDSDEWERYTAFGKLSSLVVEFSHNRDKHTVNISQTGAITLYSNYDEVYALGLVEKFNKLVSRYESFIEPKRPKGSKKIT